jgi:hypothetical protein
VRETAAKHFGGQAICCSSPFLRMRWATS